MILRRAQFELAGRVVGPFLMQLEAWQKQLRPHKKAPKKDTPFGPPLESVRKLKELMSVHYLAGRYADGAVPVAWVTSGFPMEVLRPLGFHVVYPENHAALCSAQRRLPGLAEAAENEGYSRDLCSYARNDIGAALSGETPVGRLPKPDLLCCCTNICQTTLYWYRALAEHFRVPLVLVDTPFVYGTASPHAMQYVRDQLDELVEVAQRISGHHVSREQLVDVATKAHEATLLWGECLAESRHAPAPWTGIDGFFHMAPVVALRGTDDATAYYRMLRDELQDRVRRGIGGLKNEKHRLLWDNLPMWFWVRELSTLLAARGFNIVCTSYTNAWAEAGSGMVPSDPIASAAQCYTHIILNQDLKNRLEILTRLSRDYGAHGAILHSDRSCKPYSIGQIDLKNRLQNDVGIRVLLFEADHGDPRAFAQEPGENRLTAFMESFA